MMLFSEDGLGLIGLILEHIEKFWGIEMYVSDGEFGIIQIHSGDVRGDSFPNPGPVGERNNKFLAPEERALRKFDFLDASEGPNAKSSR